MIIGCGVDLVNINRIRKLIIKWDFRFLNRVFTEQEISYCEGKKENKYQSYSGFFAAKEAYVKAIGTGFRNIAWKDIEIRNNDIGKPDIYLLSEGIKKDMNKRGTLTNQLSISHTKEMAIALVIIDSRDV